MRSAPPAKGLERIEAFFASHAYDAHRHDTYALGYTLAGVQSFDYRGVRCDSQHGDVIVLHPDVAHDGRAGDADGFQYRMIYVEPRLVVEALDDPRASLPFVSDAVRADPRLAAALRLALGDLDHDLEPLQRDAALAAIASALSAADPCARQRRLSATCAVAVDLARAYLREHVDQIVTSEALEAVSGLDRYSLARHFRARLGASPYRYLTLRRLDAVRTRIAAGEGLAEASAAAGFADQSHMTRHFKRAFGISPGRWRALQARAYSAA